jgi:hypothetical protein
MPCRRGKKLPRRCAAVRVRRRLSAISGVARPLLHNGGNFPSTRVTTMTLSTASLFALNQNAYAANANEKAKSGTVSDMKHGDGTFEKTMSEINGQRTCDKTITYADGTTKTKERVVTINEDGSKSITKVGKNGKTSSVNESFIQNADGSVTINKEKTAANGEVVEISGTRSKVNGETDVHIVRTNAEGQTATIDRQTTKDGHTKTHIKSGTGYDGQAIYDESNWTVLT